MTDAELDEIAARAEAADFGPWEVMGHNAVGSAELPYTVADCGWPTEEGFPGRGRANAAFIAHSRADVPALVAEVRRQRQAMRDALDAEDAADMYLTIKEAVEGKPG